MTLTISPLYETIIALERRLDAADAATWAAVQAEVHALKARHCATDQPLPKRLVDLERRITDADADDVFDNMPV